MTIKEFVVATLLSESGDVFHKRIKRWRKSHYEVYHQLLGLRKKIGIEIEFNSYLTTRDRDEYLDQFEKIRSSYWIKTGNFLKGFELTCLYNVDSPQALRARVMLSLNQLKPLKFSTLGGLHINVQMHIDKDCFLTERKLDGQFESPELCRHEFKRGVGFLNPQCLIAQLILVSKACCISTNLITTATLESYNDIVDVIDEFYPKALEATRVDLSSYRF